MSPRKKAGLLHSSREGAAPSRGPVLTPEGARLVASYLAVFEQEGFAFGEMRCDAGVMPYAVRARELNEFEQTLYNSGFILAFDWLSWAEHAAIYFEDPRRLAEADLETLQRLFTTMVRQDRFCEGSLLAHCKSGFVVALLRRLNRLAG